MSRGPAYERALKRVGLPYSIEGQRRLMEAWREEEALDVPQGTQADRPLQERVLRGEEPSDPPEVPDVRALWWR